MKIPMNLLSLSAGKFDESGGMLYGSVMILDDKNENIIEPDRINVGQKHAKVKLDTDKDNQLAKSLSVSGLIPGIVVVEVEQIVKKGEISMIIVGFDSPKKL